MNIAQIKSVLVFLLFAVIGFGPISPGCLIGMYIVLARPAWFAKLADAVYAGKAAADWQAPLNAGSSHQVRLKAFLSLLTLFIIDILPVPVTPVIALLIIFSRPLWFYQLVKRVYQ